ncbi:helix-turn-helix domain-containing protein [Roseomonas rosulenta]|uniref:helix-turn-helix domain-containing protein n=1 Tax=Roseomonas rosulenta TaxID=2748667 RepID=UPI0018DF7C7E
MLQVGDVVMQHAADSAHVTRAAIQPGLSAVIVPLHCSGRMPVTNGTTIGAQDAILVPGGMEFIVACPDPQVWGSFALPTAMAEELADLSRDRHRDAMPGVLDMTPEIFGELSAAFDAAGRLAHEAPSALIAPGCAEGLAASLKELVASALAPGLGTEPRGRAVREAMRVVRAADEYLRHNISHPIYRDDLCGAIGVSRRKLHDAFVSVVGMTPPAYLKLRRLVLARRALRAGNDGERLVKSVALSHGFWHLGHFSKDYRELFGELPSQTAAATHPS